MAGGTIGVNAAFAAIGSPIGIGAISHKNFRRNALYQVSKRITNGEADFMEDGKMILDSMPLIGAVTITLGKVRAMYLNISGETQACRREWEKRETKVTHVIYESMKKSVQKIGRFFSENFPKPYLKAGNTSAIGGFGYGLKWPKAEGKMKVAKQRH